MKNAIQFIKLTCLISALLISCLINLTAQNEITGYTYAGMYGGHVYYISDCSSTWYNANAATTEMGGYLATISDIDENSFIQSVVSGGGTWIGYQNGLGWFNGEPLTFINVSSDYESDGYWDWYGLGAIYPNGTWGTYFSNYYNPRTYIVEFDTNPDCNNPNKTYVCHNGNTICVNSASLQSHLDHGDFAGPCGPCNTNAMQAPPDDESAIEGHSLPIEKRVFSEPEGEREIMEEIQSLKQIQFSPNPASSEIQIILPKGFQEGTLRILSLTGQEMQSLSLIGQQSISIELSMYASGLYLIDIRSTDGHYQKKFVKL